MAEDPRDPRTPQRSMVQTLDSLASGFDAFITSNRGMLGEVLSANRDIAQSLAVLARTIQEQSVVAGGAAGMPTGSTATQAEIEHVERMQGRVDANRRMVVRASPTTTPPRSLVGGIMDYRLDPNRPLTGQTRSNMRKNVFNVVSARADAAAQADTDWQWVSGGGRVLLNDGYTIDEMGRYRGPSGRYASASDAVSASMSESEGNSLVRRAAMYNVGSRVAKSFSEGAPVGRALMSALPAGALKAAGVAGAVLYAGDKVLDTIQSQAAINRQFQGVYGGGLMEQFDDRASQWMNRNITGRFSLLGAENYDALFRAGMGLGLRGGDRSDFIRTGADIMGQTGASSDFTTRVMSMSIEAGLGLQGLAEAIKSVSNAAKDAGINANRARDVFLKNYEAGAEVMFGSQAAKSFAEYMTVGQLSQARPYQNVNQMGAFQDRRLSTAMAYSLGMTPSQLQVAQRESPGAAIGMAEQYARTQANSLQSELPGARSIEQVVRDFIAEKEAYGLGYDPALDQMELGEALVREGYNENRIADYLRSRGYSNVTPGNAPGILANLFVPGASPGSIAVQSEAERARFYGDTTFDTMQVESSSRRAKGQMTTHATNLPFAIGPRMNVTDEGRLTRAYYETVLGGGVEINSQNLANATRRPILESIIQTSGVSRNSRVRVATADGPKVVTLEEAIRDFPDQLESGQARYVDAVDDTLMGQSTISGLGVSSEISDAINVTSNTRSISYGQSYDEFRQQREEEKKKSAEEGGGTDRVTFDLTPEAKRLLTPVNDPWYNPDAPFYNGVGMEP